MKLSSLAHGRNNNFNLIRIGAAFMVLISHSHILALGPALDDPSGNEPLIRLVGFTLGAIAVHIFFITSGFLVTGSLLSRQNTLDFLSARSLRIFPGLIIMTVLTVFALGPFFTVARNYFSARQTYAYLLRCSTLISGIELELPGVFENNPLRGVVNSPLWTLPREILMYLMLAFIWVMARKKPLVFKRLATGLFFMAWITALVRHFYFPERDDLAVFFFMFFAGAAVYLFKKRIALSRAVFWSCLIAVLASAAVNQSTFFIVYLLTVPYLTIYVAYVPSGHIRHYNKVGDYSYGVYIYGFPIQQSVVALFLGISVIGLFFVSAITTLFLAMLSWHLIERRALEFKSKTSIHLSTRAHRLALAPRL
jgi:peptidoglycan/LPS O-acetylase OafA/YrhL